MMGSSMLKVYFLEWRPNCKLVLNPRMFKARGKMADALSWNGESVGGVPGTRDGRVKMLATEGKVNRRRLD